MFSMIKNLKISKIIKKESNFFHTVFIDFEYENEIFHCSADFDIDGNLKESALEKIEVFNEHSFQVNLSNFLKIEETLNNFFWRYLEKENDYLNFHCTGKISDDSYSNYTVQRDFNKYPVLRYSFIDKMGECIELRQSGESLKYVKKDENDEIIRDSNGMAVYLNEDEMIKKGLNLFDTTLVAFNEKKESVGLASDEWGADGVWINSNYQKRGIGSVLLEQFRTQFPEDRKIGQMTFLGKKLVRSMFRKNNL